MNSREFFWLVLVVGSLAAFVGGLILLVGTRGGRRYIVTETVPSVRAPAWVVAVALAVAFLGYPYEATWVLSAILVFSLSVPTVVVFWGFRGFSPWWALMGGACVCLATLPVEAFGLWAWREMFEEMGWGIPSQGCVARFIDATLEGRLAMIPSLVLEAPFVEEMALTGMLYPWLKGRLNRFGAAFLTALVFALLHYHPSGIPQFFLHSLTATWLFEVTGSLLPAMSMHFAGNALVTISLWLAYPCRVG
ncbi:MAG TPA: CPBP family intramembrane metalloprotease [Verrucomicrobiae bacterium]|nr:CPBP family intramembrane metalloprotease [Verrucomicrobiae bacterium]